MRGELEAPSVRAKALDYLSRREHARPELERKLLSKGYPREDVEAVLNELESDALLSHERLINDYIRSAERRGYGPLRIRQELKSRKQLGDSEIEKGMAENEVDWVACARRCSRKKFGERSPASNKEYFKRRDYLFRRGFPEDIIRAVLSEEAVSPE